MQIQNKMFYQAYSSNEAIQVSIEQARFNQQLNTNFNRIKVYETINKLITSVSHYYPELVVNRFSNSGVIFVDEINLNYIQVHENNNLCSISIMGDQKFLDNISTFFNTNYELVTSYINWVYSSSGESVSLPLDYSLQPRDSMYPMINSSLNEYYERFMRSSASVLVLRGDPGLGKTGFIRGLINYANTSAMVSYDETILSEDRIFAQFLEDNSIGIFVLEDSDNMLSSRTSGNNLMHKFLNVSDGLVSSRKKKMIFSTNLPSVKDIDEALIRPGRCFDILEFDKLTRDQAQAVANDFNIVLPEDKKEFTIAEIFHHQTNTKQFKFGFNI